MLNQITPAQINQEVENFLNNGSKKPHVLVLAGPTASGKTALSLDLAKRYNGEIISADSRQVYKKMDIGTEKIMPAEMAGIKHYLIDLVNPDEEFTLADYKRNAESAIEKILKTKKTPILCGGTGLYISAVIDNYTIPTVPPQTALRTELEEYAAKNGPQALYERLQEKDAGAAARIEHPNNVRYVIRALEIALSGQQKKDQRGESKYDTLKLAYNWPREVLYERINSRVETQIDRGLIDEVKALLAAGYSPSLPSMSGIGYAEIISYLHGKITLPEAVELIKKNTRNYAKRQLTWFRRDQSIIEINPN